MKSIVNMLSCSSLVEVTKLAVSIAASHVQETSSSTTAAVAVSVTADGIKATPQRVLTLAIMTSRAAVSQAFTRERVWSIYQTVAEKDDNDDGDDDVEEEGGQNELIRKWRRNEEWLCIRGRRRGGREKEEAEEEDEKERREREKGKRKGIS